MLDLLIKNGTVIDGTATKGKVVDVGIESLSVIIQLTSKKIRHKKVFHSAPIHHHFEALGWPECKITMRFWIIAWVMASIGLVIGLMGMGSIV